MRKSELERQTMDEFLRSPGKESGSLAGRGAGSGWGAWIVIGGT